MTYAELNNGATFEYAKQRLGSKGPWIKVSDKRLEHVSMTTPEDVKVGFRVYVTDFEVIPCEAALEAK